jgi:hypothetical protein
MLLYVCYDNFVTYNQPPDPKQRLRFRQATEEVVYSIGGIMREEKSSGHKSVCRDWNLCLPGEIDIRVTLINGHPVDFFLFVNKYESPICIPRCPFCGIKLREAYSAPEQPEDSPPDTSVA